MTAFGLGVYVWQLTHSAVDVSMVEMAALLPSILLCPSAGDLADYVFNPALVEGGVLANTVGKIIGTGETRGIGFLIILAGLCLIITALIVSKSKSIRKLKQRKK